ncbi:Transcription initiation factor TFIID subunit 1 [Cichlidogyrus casuarinus]|uniref:Transcription initiation factor TFIID subunit 1 n=1 Tax=Cichlidogyrus casuarinus TaxID=1844966 RepID=A0ABD2QMR5_9PLAT
MNEPNKSEEEEREQKYQESQQQDGPKYKFTTFMFGNVDKNAKLEEEYAKDGELQSLNDVDKCRVTEVEHCCSEVLKDAQKNLSADGNSNKEESPKAPLVPADYYDEKETLPDPDILLVSKGTTSAVLVEKNEDDDYDEDDDATKPLPIEIPAESDKSASLMPPPSQVPSSSKQKSKDQMLPSPEMPSPNISDKSILNTPLGNLMPPEYSDVPIKELFPEYDPDDTPKWMRIFRLAHPLCNYHEIKDRKGFFPQNGWKPSDGDVDFLYHLYYDDYLDLGALPMSEKSYAKFEETCELFQPMSYDPELDSASKFLAGHPKSWWNRAFDALLAGNVKEARNHSRADDWRMPKLKTDQALLLNEINVNNEESKTEDNKVLKRLNSLTPSEDDADITTWTDWRLPKVDEETKTPPSVEDMKMETEDVKPANKVDLNPETIYPYNLLNWEDDIIYDAQLSSNKISLSAKQNAAYAGWIPLQNCRTMNTFLDSYQGRYPGILPSKTLFSSTSVNQFAKDVPRNVAPFPARPGSALPAGGSSSQNAWPYSLFPIDNYGIIDGSWESDIIYDSAQAAQIPPFLLTLNLNDEICVHDETLSDADLAALALAVVNNPNAKQIAARYGISEASLKTLLSHVTMEDGSISADANSAKQQQPVNRTSFHVSFGFASTKGMLTGALAKAAKGAEKVKRILSKHGLLAKEEPSTKTDEYHEELGADGNMASAAAAAIGLPPKDPLNLSNDEFYATRGGGNIPGSLARCGPLQHSVPAVELWPPIFPTYMSPLRLQQFHRIPLKKFNRGQMAQYFVAHPVVNLTRTISKKLREREDAKAACGGGEMFFMRTPQDLTGADGDILLFENSEEYPPLIMQVGMATRLINYYRPMAPKDPSLSPDRNATAAPPDLQFGSVVYVGSTDSPFLGTVRPGGYLQTLENNMYRATVYEHNLPSTDFLVIRSRNGLSIRKVSGMYCVGQQVPLMEVPSPNSKRANNFMRDFLQVYVLRMFMQSVDDPKRIKMEDIREAFPNHSESSIRKRLKISADFKRTGIDASWWVLRPDYKIPTEEEIRYLVSPEDVCAYYSMLAAELRLKEAGYGEKCLELDDINPEDEGKEGQPKLEDEVKAAPWNTTRAYLAAQRGGCFLELHGAADPTGCGEAFSYSKASTKPGALFRQAGGEAARGLLTGKKTVTGTDADLRKLHLRDAKALLLSYGIAESDLKTFKRWEIIDMVRFTSTERAKQGEEEDTAKFARGNRLSLTEQVRCYRDECQRIFDLQNRVLSNAELLSSDEEVSSDEEEEDQLFPDSASVYQNAASKNVHSLMSNKMTSNELAQKQEEADRQQLLRRALEGKDNKKPRKTNPLAGAGGSNSSLTKLEATAPAVGLQPGHLVEANAQNAGAILDLTPPWPQAQRRTLKIIKQTRGTDFIHAYVGSAEDENKESQKKEKRRMQEQLRKMKRSDPYSGISTGTLTLFGAGLNTHNYVPLVTLIANQMKDMGIISQL